MARATGKALVLLKLLYDFWKESGNRWAGKVLTQDHPGLTECLDAGWVKPAENVLGKYLITKDGSLQLGLAGYEIADEHD